MAKKLKGRESRPDPMEGISESAQQIWAAGMAAFEEARRITTPMFIAMSVVATWAGKPCTTTWWSSMQDRYKS